MLYCLLLFGIAILPVIILMVFIYRQDKYQKEPIKSLAKAFIGGMLAIPLDILLVTGIDSALAGTAITNTVFFSAFLEAGIPEELSKFLIFMIFIWNDKNFDEYFDGIVYAAYLSLGFACVENIGYVLQGSDQMLTALMRGVLAVPAHFLFAVTMGYYVSLAKFDPQHRGGHLFKAFLFPMLLHGTYDALLMVASTLGEAYGEESEVVIVTCAVLFVVFIIFDIKMWRWGLKRIKRHQERSKEQGFDRLHPFDGFTWNI